MNNDMSVARCTYLSCLDFTERVIAKQSNKRVKYKKPRCEIVRNLKQVGYVCISPPNSLPVSTISNGHSPKSLQGFLPSFPTLYLSNTGTTHKKPQT